MTARRLAIMLVVAVAATAGSASGSGYAARPAGITLATFAGRWTGHTRFLRVRRDGRATEVIYDGCCDPVLNLTLQLSRPTGTPADASARAVVTGVWVRDRTAFTTQHPAPHVGEAGTLRLRHSVIDEPFTETTYCAAGGTRCGA